MKKIVYLIALFVLANFVLAECNEDNIKLFLNENKKDIVREVNKNVDNSFKAYEKYNTAQLRDFVSRLDNLFKKISTFLVISIFAGISFWVTFWNLILVKRLRKILTLISEDIAELKGVKKEPEKKKFKLFKKKERKDVVKPSIEWTQALDYMKDG